MTQLGPYATAADAYWSQGWRGVLPLPARAKKNPPRGYTGDSGIYPSYADLTSWCDGPERLGNIALRLPSNVIGIDVDAYGDKPGADTLTLAEAQHGPLPRTWRTTSRDDGVSGIRLYRVPEGLAWPGEIGAATELIQTRHRYALVWPSIHPEGRTYRWISPEGVISTSIPDPDQLPALPQAWVDAYTGGVLATTTPRVNVAHADAVAWIAAQPHATADMCTRMERALGQFADDLKGSAHNSTRDAVLRVARLAEEGHHGAVHALASVRRDFLADATDANRSLLGKARRTENEAVHEFGELVASGVGVVLGNPTGISTCDCFGQLTGLLTPATGLADTPATHAGVEGSAALAPAPAPAAKVDETTPDASEQARFKDGASFILDAPDELPNLWGSGDQSLWAEGEALMICGPPGVGKTTLSGQVLRGLLGLQSTVLGLPVRPAERRVLYLAMDRPAQIARGLRRAFHESEREHLAEHLRFWEGPPPGDVARHPTVLLSLAELAEAEVIIIDSVKDAAVGLTEDETAAAYNRARQNCLANGVQVLELHHMVKRGANGNKPTELADVYGSAWLTAGAGSVVLLWGAAGDPVVQMSHLKQPASEVGPWKLIHDHERGTTDLFHSTDLLTLTAAAGEAGVAPNEAARHMFDTENPTEAQKEKARRSLRRLVSQGHLECREGVRDVWSGGRPQSRFYAVMGDKESQPRPTTRGADLSVNPNHAPTTRAPGENPTTPNHTQPRGTPISRSNPNHDPNHANHAPGPTTPAPPFNKGGGWTEEPLEADSGNGDEPKRGSTLDCNGCGLPFAAKAVIAHRGYCAGCAKQRGVR